MGRNLWAWFFLIIIFTFSLGTRKLLEPSKKVLRTMTSVAEETPGTLFSSANSDYSTSQCAKDICGSPEQILSLNEMEQSYLNKRHAVEEAAKYRSFIQKMIEGLIENYKLDLEWTQKFLEESERFSLNKDAHRAAANNLFLDALESIKYEKGISFVEDYANKIWTDEEIIDFEKLIKEDIGEENLPWFRRLFKKKFMSKELETFSKIRQIPSSNFLVHYFYPDKSFNEGAQALAIRNLSLSQMVRSLFPLSHKPFSLSGELSTDNFANFNEIEFKKEILSMLNYEVLIDTTESHEDFYIDPYVYLEKFYESGTNKILNIYFENSEMLSYLGQTFKNSCLRDLEKTFANSFSELRLRIFQKRIDDVKSASLRILNIESADLKKNLEEELARLSFEIPSAKASREVYMQKLKEDLDIALSTKLSLKKEGALNQDFFSQLFVSRYLRFYDEGKMRSEEIAMFGLEDLFFQEQVFSEAKNFCSDFVSQPYSEMLIPFEEGNNSKIIVSWTMVNFPSYGIGTLAHEMAHFIAFKLRKIGERQNGNYYAGLAESLPLWEKRSCIRSYYKDPELKALAQELAWPEGLLTEEDWADFFAARVVRELRSSEGKDYSWLKNFACPMLTQNEDDFMVRYAPEHSYDDQGRLYSVDTHSSAIVRLLHIEKESRDQLSPSCQQEIENKKLFNCD